MHHKDYFWVNHEWTRIFIPQDSWRLVKIRGSTLYCSEYSNATNIWGLTTNALRFTNEHELLCREMVRCLCVLASIMFHMNDDSVECWVGVLRSGQNV